MLNKCVEVDPALANAWRFQFTPDTLHCDVPGCLYHHQVCAAGDNAIKYFLDLALASDEGKTHFTTIQQAVDGHAAAAYVGQGYIWTTACPVHPQCTLPLKKRGQLVCAPEIVLITL